MLLFTEDFTIATTIFKSFSKSPVFQHEPRSMSLPTSSPNAFRYVLDADTLRNLFILIKANKLHTTMDRDYVSSRKKKLSSYLKKIGMKCSKLVFHCSNHDATTASCKILSDFNSCKGTLMLQSVK